MAKKKAVLRARAAAQRAEQSAGREPSAGEIAPPAAEEAQERPAPREQGFAAGQREPCAPLPGRSGIARRLWSRVETAAYRAYERISGLSEDRPALGVVAAAPVLRALGVAAPRIASSVTVSRARAAVLGALRDAEGVRRYLQRIARVEMGVAEATSTIWAAGMGGRERVRTGIVSLADAPGERGTEIRAVLPGARPRGWLARAAGRLLAEEPRRRLRGDLRRLRQWIEVGEIPTTVGQPSGRTGRERT
ncbi:hypothetical protein BE18_45825 [Sorangium cellulosum]|uniref:Uncharacterized protein n=1 Tax=Sorangium cellulosum TaxID=56 RepID=A0A150SA25_SORCE|nr:hypothetical protein BE18_45825 [Sorangium cellulosum]